MLNIKSIFVIAILLLVFVSCNNETDDKKIQDNITKILQDNKNYAGVISSVENGVVTLTGMCEGDNCADTIEKKILDVNGVNKVENNIVIDNSTDMTMRTSVQTIITKYPGVQADVVEKVIVLRGVIDRDNLQSLMSDLEALHPQKIDNQLVVK
jgi:hypothetical protein